MEFPSILLQSEKFLSSQLIQKLFPIIAISIDAIPLWWWLFSCLCINVVMVDRTKQKKNLPHSDFCCENNSLWSWMSIAAQLFFWFRKVLHMQIHLWLESSTEKKFKHARSHTHTNTNKSINKMKFIVKKKFEVSKLFQTILMEWNCIFFPFSHIRSVALNRCIAPLNYFDIHILIQFLLFLHFSSSVSHSRLATNDKSLISTSMELTDSNTTRLTELKICTAYYSWATTIPQFEKILIVHFARAEIMASNILRTWWCAILPCQYLLQFVATLP